MTGGLGNDDSVGFMGIVLPGWIVPDATGQRLEFKFSGLYGLGAYVGPRNLIIRSYFERELP